MKAIIAVAFVLIQQATPAPPSPSSRMLFASRLFMATVEARVKAGHDVAGLSIEAMGVRNEILAIQDNTDDAKEFFIHLQGDPETRAGLLRLGFKMVVLANEAHGTFVFTLKDNGYEKPEIRIG